MEEDSRLVHKVGTEWGFGVGGCDGGFNDSGERSWVRAVVAESEDELEDGTVLRWAGSCGWRMINASSKPAICERATLSNDVNNKLPSDRSFVTAKSRSQNQA